MSKRANNYDKRLIGTWRSDRRRTVGEWVYARRATEQRRKRVAEMFGHLTLRFTRKRIYSEFKGSRDVQYYEVLASDSDSVAISHWDSVFVERRVQHFHFEGEHYWIALGRNREFFRRVGAANKTVQRTGASRFARSEMRTSSAAGSRR